MWDDETTVESRNEARRNQGDIKVSSRKAQNTTDDEQTIREEVDQTGSTAGALTALMLLALPTREQREGVSPRHGYKVAGDWKESGRVLRLPAF